MQTRGHLHDVTAEVLEELLVAVTAPEAYPVLAGQVDRVEDILVPAKANRIQLEGVSACVCWCVSGSQ